MYGIDGRAELDRVRAPDLAGYRDSHPVRIGNAAADQRQLDIYGEMIDSIYLYNKYGKPIYYDTWENVRRIVDWRWSAAALPIRTGCRVAVARQVGCSSSGSSARPSMPYMICSGPPAPTSPRACAPSASP